MRMILHIGLKRLISLQVVTSAKIEICDMITRILRDNRNKDRSIFDINQL